MGWPEGVLFYSDSFSPYFEEYYFAPLNALFPPVPHTVPVWSPFRPFLDYLRFEPEGFPVEHGLGILQGTVVAEGQPLPRRIFLFADQFGHPGNQTLPQTIVAVTDPNEAGEWVFTGLSTARTYTIRSFDTEGVFDPAVKAGLIPETL